MANLVIRRGDDYSALVTLWEDDDHTIPADLTGYTAKSQIRVSTDGVLLAEFDASVSDPEAGEITLVLDHDITETMNRGGVWDLQIIDDADWITTVVAGRVIIKYDVTRDEP